MRGSSLVVACALIGAGVAFAAEPQYPMKPIRVLVGFPPGGAADVVGRIVAQQLASVWGHQMVIDNRPGGGGNAASEVVANGNPDGYTLLMIGTSHAMNAGLFSKLAYHPSDSFAAVALVASVPQILVSSPSLPAKNIGELVTMAKASPGKLNFGSGGTGSASHLVGELLKSMTGADIVHVPYKGAALAMTDVIGGQIQLAFSSLPAAIPQVKAGRLKGLGVTSAKRSPSLPDVPTIAESGVPGYEATGWTGMLAPAATPPRIVARLNAEINTALKTPDVLAALSKQGAEPEGGSPQHFAKYLRSEIAKWTKVIRGAGIQPN